MELQNVAAVVRGLAADAVENAGSGHPGAPIGLADIGSILFFDTMNFNSQDPEWVNRDRFVLSGGHGSMLLYALLHLTGYDVTLDDLKRFRTFCSKTPGHPEYGHTPGVEVTTGPLGQGIASAVGMALAERMQAARFNQPGYDIVDHYTYVLLGDGDMMEGVSAEASSLAGHLKLGKLIAVYDSNGITIEGSTDLAFSEAVDKRYEAYGWHVQSIDGHDHEQIRQAIKAAQAETERPSLIVATTEIAKGAPTKANTADAHGAPLGKEEIVAMKRQLGLPADQEFFVSEEAVQLQQAAQVAGAKKQAEWEQMFKNWRQSYPQLASEWDAAYDQLSEEQLALALPKFSKDDSMASRKASGIVLNALADAIPHLIGGSADLAPSNNTELNGKGEIQAGAYSGRNIRFGVREHAMGAILNGISLHGGFRVFGATFLVFSDYVRPSIRLAALMNQPVVFIFTHDSIFVGEDGPTHQPIEHIESLRNIPNLTVFRPADAEETAVCWKEALQQQDGPVALILTRQSLPLLDKTEKVDAKRGAYLVVKEAQELQVTLVATGSEVNLAVQAARLLQQENIGARVVSMPSRDLFSLQGSSFRQELLPAGVPILAIEAGVGSGWYSLAPDGKISVVSLDSFGACGSADELAEHFGFEAQKVVTQIKERLL